MKSTKGSNYSVCLTFVVRNSNQYFLWDVLRQKLEFPALVAAAKSQAQKFKPKSILIEDQTSGTSLIAQLRSDGLQGIIPIKSVKSKTQRMEGETAKLESGSLLLPESAHWLEDFLKEYLAFPNGKYDDQIDALSQFLSWQGSHQRTEFECDFGHGDDSGRRHGATSLGAPSAEELCWLLGR
jgi:predicted phage terminase large subunit-like protein